MQVYNPQHHPRHPEHPRLLLDIFMVITCLCRTWAALSRQSPHFQHTNFSLHFSWKLYSKSWGLTKEVHFWIISHMSTLVVLKLLNNKTKSCHQKKSTFQKKFKFLLGHVWLSEIKERNIKFGSKKFLCIWISLNLIKKNYFKLK